MSGLSIAGLSFSYDGPRSPTIDDVSFAVSEGSLCAVVGPNGSGKSTLLKVISGYLKPASGSVSVGGKDPRMLNDAERAALVTYCGDEAEPAFDFTVMETVQLGRIARGDGQDDEKAALQAMDAVGLAGLSARAVTSLSSGERQRAFIARAICQDPRFFLLDEPTAHLDMAYELLVMEMVKDMTTTGKTVLAVVHDLNLALRYASRMFFLKDGKLRYDIGPEEVDAHVIADIYGVEACITAHPALGCPVVLPISLT